MEFDNAGIGSSDAPALAASLTLAAATVTAENLRANGQRQADPHMYVKQTYIEMLDFIREHHGLPRDPNARRP